MEQTISELLNVYQSKAVGLCWSVPDDVFTTAMQEFDERCWQYYGSFEAVLSSEATVDIMVA